MSSLTRDENRELAAMMLRESWDEKRDREAAHRALPEAAQPSMVVVMGILTYRVIWIAPTSGEEGRRLAERELEFWQEKARRGGLEVLPLSRDVSEHDFQVRTQASLDALTRAIHESYR